MPLTDLTYQVICSRSISKLETELVIMIPISEKEELALDKGLLVTSIPLSRAASSFSEIGIIIISSVSTLLIEWEHIT